MTAPGGGPVAPGRPVALYVHFPFCLSICPYCDFVVVAGSAARGPRSMIARLIDALLGEVALRGPASAEARQPLRSVYLGGGTPSLMTAADVGRLLERVERSFGIAPGAEVTLEANPGRDEIGDLLGFRAAGVNRLSIGAQSMAAEELRRSGRRHSARDVAAAVAEARRAGFDNVSLDLLYDLPGQTLQSWRHSLQAVLALEPEHVSAYSLGLDDPDADGLTGPTGDHLPLRPGARRWRRSAAAEQDADRAADMYLLADELLSHAGLPWYEISNWSQPGRESRHNQAYWQGRPWQAVGPGAHAFDGQRTRRWNGARLDAYVAALEEGRLPPGGAEVADEASAMAELTILGLRTAAGVPIDTADAAQDALRRGLAAGLLEPAGGRVRLTVAGRLLSNELFVELLPAALTGAGLGRTGRVAAG